MNMINLIIYKNRRRISVAVWVSVIIILLLSLNFHIWSGSYTEGVLESIVIQQMECLEKGNTGEVINSKSLERCLHLFDYACLSGIEVSVCLLCEILFCICFGYFFFRPSVTLRSLSVRMNN